MEKFIDDLHCKYPKIITGWGFFLSFLFGGLGLVFLQVYT